MGADQNRAGQKDPDTTTSRRKFTLCAGPLALAAGHFPRFAFARAAQSVSDTPELHAGERAFYEAAAREGLVGSNNTGPTWANGAALFRAFGARYPAPRSENWINF